MASTTTDAAPYTPLQDRLDQITAKTRALVQPERLAKTEEVVAALHATCIADRVAAPGSAAPLFSLLSATGKRVHATDLYALGPVVLKFFRGRWCPYDMTELEAWQALYTRLRGHGALLVAVSPQTPRQNAFTAERHRLEFPILSDPGAAVAASLGCAYQVPEDTQRWYRSMLVNVPFLNGDETWQLPLPATVLVRPSGSSGEGAATITGIIAHTDHRVRAEPNDLLAALVAG